MMKHTTLLGGPGDGRTVRVHVSTGFRNHIRCWPLDELHRFDYQWDIAYQVYRYVGPCDHPRECAKRDPNNNFHWCVALIEIGKLTHEGDHHCCQGDTWENKEQ